MRGDGVDREEGIEERERVVLEGFPGLLGGRDSRGEFLGAGSDRGDSDLDRRICDDTPNLFAQHPHLHSSKTLHGPSTTSSGRSPLRWTGLLNKKGLCLIAA